MKKQTLIVIGLWYPINPGRGQFRTALSNSFGFGGHNAALALRRWGRIMGNQYGDLDRLQQNLGYAFRDS